MEHQNFKKRKGNRWSFLMQIKNEADWEPKDCTGFDAVMVLKRTRRAKSPVVLKKYITWEDSSEGIGRFMFSPAETRDISPRDYHYECYLFLNDESDNETIAKGIISVLSTVLAEIIPRE